MVQTGQGKEPVSQDLVRHMVLNSLRSYAKKFKREYGELIICCDGHESWRKEVFPFYKANRKKDREKSQVSWSLIFKCLNSVKEDLKEVLPYKVIEVEGAEGDDVIGTLCRFASKDQKILIIGSDKDMKQLHSKNVKQYAPVKKEFIDVADPEKALKELIIRGDTGDGIPNMLSQDDTFARGLRQKTMTAKRLKEYMEKVPQLQYTPEELKGFNRNKLLIDFAHIPDSITKQILIEYAKPKRGSKQKLMQYLMDQKMPILLQKMDEF